MRIRRRRATTLISASILSISTVLLVVSAVFANGFPVDHVKLNDGGIWVTSNVDGLFGRLNKPAGQLDAAFFPPGGAQSAYALDVVQEGAAVVAFDQGSGKLYPVDVTRGVTATSDGLPISGNDQVEMAGDTLAVLDSATGAVWAEHVDTDAGVSSLSGLDPATPPLATVGVKGAAAHAALAVGIDGTIYAVSAAGKIATIETLGAGFGKPAYSQLGHGVQAVEATAVGDRLVVVDPNSGTVVVPGGPTATLGASSGRAAPSDSVIPQTPGTASNDVVMATPSALVSVDLSSGTVTTLSTSKHGTPTAPVRLDNCVHAAWGGSGGGYVRACDGGAATAVPLAGGVQLVQPEFRVNRDAIVLNDVATGAIWDLATQKRVDNWSSVRPPPIKVAHNTKDNNDTAQDGRTLPPKAVDDTLGARPGRTTLLHVLDNDSDPSGAILSISGVTAPDNPRTHLSIAPDGQTVAIAIPEASGEVHFKYTVSDGKLTATANVTVDVRAIGQNKPPALYPGYRAHTWTVPAGGHLEIPVLSDWRDYDGDPVGLDTATAKSGTIATTPDGSLDYIAPATGGSQTLHYTVTDGIAAPVDGTVTVTVQSVDSTTAVPAVTQPDVARGEVGQPITIRPLDNDLPGSDPSDSAAKLQLAGDLNSPLGTTVVTDLETGAVVVTASRAGTYQLTYRAAFGNAAFATGAIRVDVVPDPSSATPPVAMPDAAILHGQTPTTVDVLANDFDPSGGLLVVQRAVPVSDHPNIQVAIVSGHWLRINTTDGSASSTPQVVDYTITDGKTSPVTGEVSITELPDDADTTPVTTDDYATVRAGDEVTVPVLDNDTNPAGAPMTLVPNVLGAPVAGGLVVTAASGSSDSATVIGSAFVSGNSVRYVAPATVTAPTQVTIDYVVTDASGDRKDGDLHVTIEPLPSTTNPDQPPQPQPIESRAVAGQTITVSVPTTGVDPDGDAVSVSGVGSAPSLGRVLRFNATSLTYQAYPTTAGTESFTYVVTDRYGKVGESTVRIGIVAPDVPQPPVAVDDDVTASPGAHLHVNVLSNDLVAAGDSVTIQPLKASDASLAGDLLINANSQSVGIIDAIAPPATGVPLTIRYRISDGVNAASEATLTVHSEDDADVPPVVTDAYPSLSGAAKTVTVNIGKYAQDPDDSSNDLKVQKVFDAHATSTSTTVTVTAAASARTVAYAIVDHGGATAVGLIHVPALNDAAPYVQQNTTIDVPRNGSKTVALSDVIVDPAGKTVRLTTTDKISTSPDANLKAKNDGDTSITLTATNGYTGPAALTIEVTDGASLTDPAGHIVDLNIPVQVGPAIPVLRCPSEPIIAVEGGNPVDIDVTSVCHVWAADPTTLPTLHYKASWQTTPANVAIAGSGTHKLQITADSAAVPGATGMLTIGVVGYDVTASLPIAVRAARPPTIAAAKRTTNAGKTVTVDMASLVTSELRDPVISVINVSQTTGAAATVHQNGSVVQLTPNAAAHGKMTFVVTITDVAALSRTDRIVNGTITLNVLGVPDAPGTPTVGRTLLSKSAQVSWPTPANNGAPITAFEVDYAGGSQDCPASPCMIKGLTNGTTYHFKVRAKNVVGWGKFSPVSGPATPNAVPGAVTGLATADPEDHKLQISWNEPKNEGTAITKYNVTWSGGGHQSVTARSFVATGLDNDTKYTFRVIAINAAGQGPAATIGGQSGGAPPTPSAPTFNSTDSADSKSRAVTVSWPADDPNGPGPTTYTLTRTGGGTKTVCATVTARSCRDDGLANDGTIYTYSLVAANADAQAAPSAHTSGKGPGAQMEAASTPGAITGFSATATGVDGRATIKFNAPASHGASSTVTCTAGGNSCGTWTFSTSGQSNVTETINGLSNGQATSISLKDCNGSKGLAGSGSACDSTVSSSVTTFGPLKSPSVTASASGTNVNFTVSVNPNGAPATVHVQTSKQNRTFTTGDGAWSWSSSDDMGYKATDNITLTVTASGRTTVTASKSATTAAPPATVTISQGKKCNDNGTPCVNGSCINPSCAYIHVVTANFSGNVSCSFYSTYLGGGTFANETFGPNQSKDATAWIGAPGYTVTVTCGGVAGSMIWP